MSLKDSLGYREKKAFKQFESLNDLIYRSVREQFKRFKFDEYRSYMVQWLKHSRTRQRTVLYTYPERKMSNNVYGADDNDDDENNFDDDHYEDEGGY